MNIKNVGENLYIIDLKQPKLGFRNFIGPWVYKDKELCFVVDPGPTSSINALKENLHELKITKDNLNYILLTHIHIDHAGGVGQLLSFFPNTHVICHTRGIKQLINPEKLWIASKGVLGEIAEMYGEIFPVPIDKIHFLENVSENKIRVIECLGHASHHLAFLFNNYLFIGDAAGVSYPLPNHIYLRPATPPVFDYEMAINSINKLLSYNLKDFKICYGHFGIRNNAELMLNIAKEQLTLWMRVIESIYDTREELGFEEKVMAELEKKDKYFANVKMFDEDIRNREKKFVINSIRGITGFIQKKKDSKN